MIKLLIVLAVMLSFAFIIVLLMRRLQARQNVRKSTPRQQENTQWYKQRLTELKADFSAQRITEEEFNYSKEELDKTFVTDSRNIEDDVQWRPVKPWLILVLIAVISISFYAAFGGWSQQQRATEALKQLPELGKTVLQQQQEVDTETLTTFALGLRQKLQRQGDDPIAWWIYAGLMTDLQQFDQANSAFERSLSQDPNRVGTLISYARFLLQNGSPESVQKAGGLLARALKQEPSNVEAISLSGFIAFENGSYQQAINAWQHLLTLTQVDGSRRQAVEAAIVDAKNRLQQSQRQLQITVDIADSVRQQVAPDSTLFVYITAVEGPPMPAAVKRISAPSFPVTVTLSNQDSMLPDYKMTSLEQWQVHARISKDDKIDQQSGDLNAKTVIINADEEVTAAVQLTVTDIAN